MSCPSPWFEDDDDAYNPDLNPFDRQPSEWFSEEDKHCGVQEFDWGDPEEEEEEEEDTAMTEASSEAEEEEDGEDSDSDMASVNSIPMSLGSFSTQSVYEEE